MKKSTLTLKKNFKWNFFSNVIYAISQWLIISLLAKMGNVEMVGHFALGLAMTAPVFLFTNLQLRAIQATDPEEKFNFDQYMGVRIITNLIAFLIIWIIILLNDYDATIQRIIYLVAISKLIESLSDIIHGYLFQKERMDYPAKSKIYKAILTIVLFGLTLHLTESLELSLISYCISFLIIFFTYDLLILSKYVNFKISFNLKRIIEISLLALPLGITIMITSLISNVPRYIIEVNSGIEQLGYFSAISYILVAGTTFITAIGQAISPRLSKLFFYKEYNSFKKILLFSSLFGLIIGTIGILLVLIKGEMILELIYSPDYILFNDVFLLMMISATISFVSSFLGYGITATRNFKVQPYLSVFWLFCITSTSLILIPKLGLIGAAYALIMTYAVQLLSQLVTLAIIFKRKIQEEDII